MKLISTLLLSFFIGGPFVSFAQSSLSVRKKMAEYALEADRILALTAGLLSDENAFEDERHACYRIGRLVERSRYINDNYYIYLNLKKELVQKLVHKIQETEEMRESRIKTILDLQKEIEKSADRINDTLRILPTYCSDTNNFSTKREKIESKLKFIKKNINLIRGNIYTMPLLFSTGGLLDINQ